MISTDIMEQALVDGVTVSKHGKGELKIAGDEEMVLKWLPKICENKNALLSALSPQQSRTENTPPPCRNCSRLEVIEIMGEHVPGCLYPISEGEWREGWKRLPVDLEICVCANHC